MAEPFDHPDWVFELKYDGFRARADVWNGKAELVSRRGNVYKWARLRDSIGRELHLAPRARRRARPGGRRRKNLRAIEHLLENGAEVYETTQLVNSMLGLLVFPRE